MAKYFHHGKKAGSVISALTAALLLVTGCSDSPSTKKTAIDASGGIVPAVGPIATLPPKVIDVPVVAPAVPVWSTISLMVRTDPVEPQNERFLDDWRFRIFTIDDLGRPTSPTFYAESAPDGTALVGLPGYMFQLPLLITGYNDVLPLADDECFGDEPIGDDLTLGRCRQFEIFVPAYCYDKAIWLLGPFESALWDFYSRAAERRAEAWNPSQVDCGTWLANMQALILTDEVSDELDQLSGSECEIFRREALVQALQENQNLLTPTRPPICMAERRHNGGGMERGRELDGFLVAETNGDPAAFILDIDEDRVLPEWEVEVFPDVDPIYINVGDASLLPPTPGTGLVYDICNPVRSTATPPLQNLDRIWDSANLNIKFSDDLVGVDFRPTETFILDDEDFMGTISDMRGIGEGEKLDVSSYNVKLGNGRELDHDVYDDSCAVTTILEFTNRSDDELDVELNTGVTFTNVFQDADAQVWLTSDGDRVVGDNDYWAIFQDEPLPGIAQPTPLDRHRALGVELLGHRQEDFRDVLHMVFDDVTDDLFLGLRADYELNEEEVDGERAFLVYTMHFWDDRSVAGRRALRRNIADCYEAADVWARQFFTTRYFNFFDDQCCIDDDCRVEDTISAREAAEFAARSQCFSNSRSNQRWRTDDSGYWSMNTDHGVNGDVIVNPGWLAPYMDFEIYIQKFDEAVFKGPRTIRRTDDVGALMAEIPTLVEGDRVLLKSEDNCCDDYDLVIPCVPEFTGFAGAPGIPYVPITLGPAIPVPPAAIVPVPVAEAGLALPPRGPAVGPAVPVGGATVVSGAPTTAPAVGTTGTGFAPLRPGTAPVAPAAGPSAPKGDAPKNDAPKNGSK